MFDRMNNELVFRYLMYAKNQHVCEHCYQHAQFWFIAACFGRSTAHAEVSIDKFMEHHTVELQ